MSAILRFCLLQVFFLPGLSLLRAGVIEGLVTLKGQPAYPDAVIEGVNDKVCAAKGQIKTTDWKIATDGGLADVVISIANPPTTSVAQGAKASINQEGCAYIPHINAFQAGTTLTIRNSDATLHNVRGSHYLGRGQHSEALFNVGQPIRGMTTDYTYQDEGIYRLNCDVHPWMEAWILVFKHPWFAITDLDGKFHLPDGLPDGTYTLRAWHSRFQDALEQKIQVVNGSATAHFIFDAANSQ